MAESKSVSRRYKLLFTGRFFLFLLGLFLIAMGVSLSAKALLGVSPIAAIPYSMSRIFPLFTFGCWIIAFNMLLLALEWFLLRGTIRLWSLAIQGSLVIVFGACIDGCMWLISGLAPVTYWHQIVWVCCGAVTMGLGVAATLASNISVLPADGFVLAVAKVARIDFSRVRLLSDLSMALFALALCWLCVGDFYGVREGTVLASLLCAPCVKLVMSFRKKGA